MNHPFDMNSAEYRLKRLQEIQDILAEREAQFKQLSQEERDRLNQIRMQKITEIISKKNVSKNT